MINSYFNIQYFRTPWEIILYKFEGYLVYLGWTRYGYFSLRFGGGESLGEWERNNILCVFIFQIILIFDFFSFKINFLLVVYLRI